MRAVKRKRSFKVRHKKLERYTVRYRLRYTLFKKGQARWSKKFRSRAASVEVEGVAIALTAEQNRSLTKYIWNKDGNEVAVDAMLKIAEQNDNASDLVRTLRQKGYWVRVKKKCSSDNQFQIVYELVEKPDENEDEEDVENPGGFIPCQTDRAKQRRIQA